MSPPATAERLIIQKILPNIFGLYIQTGSHNSAAPCYVFYIAVSAISDCKACGRQIGGWNWNVTDLAGNSSSVENGIPRQRPIGIRMGMHVDGEQALVPLEEHLPQRGEGELFPRQEQESNLRRLLQ